MLDQCLRCYGKFWRSSLCFRFLCIVLFVSFELWTNTILLKWATHNAMETHYTMVPIVHEGVDRKPTGVHESFNASQYNYYPKQINHISNLSGIKEVMMIHNETWVNFDPPKQQHDVEIKNRFRVGIKKELLVNASYIGISTKTASGTSTSDNTTTINADYWSYLDLGSIQIAKGFKLHPHFTRTTTPFSRSDTTLVLLASLADVESDKLKSIASAWLGPISCVIRIEKHSTDLEKLVKLLQSNDDNYDLADKFHLTDFHLLIDERGNKKTKDNDLEHWRWQWNLALDGVSTDRMLVAGEDFQLNHDNDDGNIYLKLKYMTERLWEFELEFKKAAFIVSNNAVLVSRCSGRLPKFRYSTDSSVGTLHAWIQSLAEHGYSFRSVHTPEYAASAVRIQTKLIPEEPLRVPLGTAPLGTIFGNAIRPMQKFGPTKGLFILQESMILMDLVLASQGSHFVEPGLWAIPNFIRPQYRSPRSKVTLTTQISFNKRERLVKLTSLWQAPMSASVFLSLGEIPILLTMLRNNMVAFKTVSIHLMVYTENYNKMFPINQLRNLANDAVETDFIFTADADFMPSIDTADAIQAFLDHREYGEWIRMSKLAVVVPAFGQEFSKKFENMSDSEKLELLPLSKPELLRQFKSKKVTVFHSYFSNNQGPNDSRRWMTASKPYEAVWVKNYEPYVVVGSNLYTGYLPRYWDAFKGYAFNKVTWIKELHASGYKFVVCAGDAFIVHLYHPGSGKGRTMPPENIKEERTFNGYLAKRYK